MNNTIYYFDKAERRIAKVRTGPQSDGSIVLPLDVKGNSCTPVKVRMDRYMDRMFPDFIATDLQTGEPYFLTPDQQTEVLNYESTSTN